MHRFILFLLGMALLGCQSKNQQPKVETKEAKYSYSIGVELGNELRFLHIKYPALDPELVARGVKDVLERRQLLVSENELKKTRLLVEAELMERDVEARMETDPEFENQLNANRQASRALLENNRAREDVHVTESGLQYEILKEGTGKSPDMKDEVVIRFSGTLPDGTEFDSSEKSSGGVSKYRVQHLIRGMAEALVNMQEGAHWKIYVPAELAYGRGGRKPHIGPEQALVFEIELLEVIPNQYEYKLR